jgi:HlyD family secretion protein
MKRKVLLAVVLVAAILLIASYLLGWFRNNRTSEISFSGNLEFTEVEISFKFPGLLAEMNVREGDPVRRGTVLAKLDQTQLLHQRDRVKAALASARVRSAQVATSLDLQTELVEGQIEQRRAEVRAAQAMLDELLAGARSQDLEQARAAVTRARVEFQNAEGDWKRAEQLFKDEDISASAYDLAKTRYEATAAALTQAEERLALVKEGARRETIEAARAQVERAQAGLRLSEAGRLELVRLKQEQEARLKDVEQIEAELGVLDTQLRDAVAISPIDGVVLVKSAEPGEVVAAGAAVLSLGDCEHPWVRGYVGESDLGRVKLGAKVRVTTDSHPGKAYWGKVSFLSSEAEFTPKQIQTPEERIKLVYRIKVELPNPNQELKLNMPVDAVLSLE